MFRLKVKPRFALTSPQLSEHRPDQRESLLPATFHQRHPEDLPERRQRIGLSQRYGLLHHGLPLPRTAEQQLWYDPFTDVYSPMVGPRSGPRSPSVPPARRPPQTSGFPPRWTTGRCLRGRCLMTAPTGRPSWRSGFTRAEPSATDFPSTFT